MPAQHVYDLIMPQQTLLELPKEVLAGVRSQGVYQEALKVAQAQALL